MHRIRLQIIRELVKVTARFGDPSPGAAFHQCGLRVTSGGLAPAGGKLALNDVNSRCRESGNGEGALASSSRAENLPHQLKTKHQAGLIPEIALIQVTSGEAVAEAG